MADDVSSQILQRLVRIETHLEKLETHNTPCPTLTALREEFIRLEAWAKATVEAHHEHNKSMLEAANRRHAELLDRHEKFKVDVYKRFSEIAANQQSALAKWLDKLWPLALGAVGYGVGKV